MSCSSRSHSGSIKPAEDRAVVDAHLAELATESKAEVKANRMAIDWDALVRSNVRLHRRGAEASSSSDSDAENGGVPVDGAQVSDTAVVKANSVDVADATSDDDVSVTTRSTVSGAYRSDKKTSITKGFAPGGFVRRSSTHDDEDPFDRTYRSALKQSGIERKSSSVTTPRSKRDFRSATTWRSGSSAVVKSSSSSSAATTPTPSAKVTDANAQSVYPPSCCVFVANLSSSNSDAELEIAVKEAFKAFGKVYVKVRRDAKTMPFAFCQFTKNADAEAAVIRGSKMEILGRPCRTEMAAARRTYIIVKKASPHSLTEAEVRSVVGKYGKIDNVWLPSKTTRVVYGLDYGFFVEFNLYDSGRDALAALRDDVMYTLSETPKQGGTVATQPKLLIKDNGVAEYEPSSIFIGNLPLSSTKASLRKEYGAFGIVVDVQILRQRSTKTDGDYMAAFLRFETPSSVQAAIKEKNLTLSDGKLVKVAPKRMSHEDLQARARQARNQVTPARAYTTYNPTQLALQAPFTPVPTAASYANPFQTPVYTPYIGGQSQHWMASQYTPHTASPYGGLTPWAPAPSYGNVMVPAAPTPQPMYYHPMSFNQRVSTMGPAGHYYPAPQYGNQAFASGHYAPEVDNGQYPAAGPETTVSDAAASEALPAHGADAAGATEMSTAPQGST